MPLGVVRRLDDVPHVVDGTWHDARVGLLADHRVRLARARLAVGEHAGVVAVQRRVDERLRLREELVLLAVGAAHGVVAEGLGRLRRAGRAAARRARRRKPARRRAGRGAARGACRGGRAGRTARRDGAAGGDGALGRLRAARLLLHRLDRHAAALEGHAGLVRVELGGRRLDAHGHAHAPVGLRRGGTRARRRRLGGGGREGQGERRHGDRLARHLGDGNNDLT